MFICLRWEVIVCFKQWWSTILPISTKQTITSHLQKVLNSDGQQFHQYQQNKQSPLTSNKWT
jgi:hypothetical protein